MKGWFSTARILVMLFGITLVVSWGFEQVGAATGLIYGVYHYGDALGPKPGHAPYAQ